MISCNSIFKLDFLRRLLLLLACLTLLSQTICGNQLVFRVLNSVAQSASNGGKDDYAEQLLKFALSLAKGDDDIAAASNNLAEVYRKKGRYPEAEFYCTKAIETDEKHGASKSDLANDYNTLGLIYEAQGKYKEAKLLLTKALRMFNTESEFDQQVISTSLNNLGIIAKELGHFTEAKTLYRRSLSMRQNAKNPDFKEIATTINNLGSLYDQQGNSAQAELYFKQALAVIEKASSPSNPDLVMTLSNLGALYSEQNKFRLAEETLNRALTIEEHAPCINHYELAQVLDNMVSMYSGEGEFKKALPFCQRAEDEYSKSLGPDHPRTEACRFHCKFLSSIGPRVTVKKLYNSLYSLEPRAKPESPPGRLKTHRAPAI